jgi:hypothetical protein
MWLSRTARLPRRFPRGAGGALVVLWAPGDAFAAPDGAVTLLRVVAYGFGGVAFDGEGSTELVFRAAGFALVVAPGGEALPGFFDGDPVLLIFVTAGYGFVVEPPLVQVHSTFALCCELGRGDRSRGGWDVIVT